MDRQEAMRKYMAYQRDAALGPISWTCKEAWDCFQALLRDEDHREGQCKAEIDRLRVTNLRLNTWYTSSLLRRVELEGWWVRRLWEWVQFWRRHDYSQ